MVGLSSGEDDEAGELEEEAAAGLEGDEGGARLWEKEGHASSSSTTAHEE